VANEFKNYSNLDSHESKTNQQTFRIQHQNKDKLKFAFKSQAINKVIDTINSREN
jgi:hypothetical protein